jgi:hypothetical protein
LCIIVSGVVRQRRTNIRQAQLTREKTIARRKRQTQEQNGRGSLLKDSTNQELSGTG